MKNLELYDMISETLTHLRKDEMDLMKAKEIFNGCGKLIALTKLQFQFLEVGLPVAVPMFGYEKDVSPRDLNGLSRKNKVTNQIKKVGKEGKKILETT